VVLIQMLPFVSGGQTERRDQHRNDSPSRARLALGRLGATFGLDGGVEVLPIRYTGDRSVAAGGHMVAWQRWCVLHQRRGRCAPIR
jgi:hypothetical protein